MFPLAIPPLMLSHCDILLTVYTDMARRALDALQSLSELNLQLGRGLAETMIRANADLARTAASHLPALNRSVTTLAEEFMHEARAQTVRASEKMAEYQPASQLRH